MQYNTKFRAPRICHWR